MCLCVRKYEMYVRKICVYDDDNKKGEEVNFAYHIRV